MHGRLMEDQWGRFWLVMTSLKSRVLLPWWHDLCWGRVQIGCSHMLQVCLGPNEASSANFSKLLAVPISNSHLASNILVHGLVRAATRWFTACTLTIGWHLLELCQCFLQVLFATSPVSDAEWIYLVSSATTPHKAQQHFINHNSLPDQTSLFSSLAQSTLSPCCFLCSVYPHCPCTSW